MENKILEFLNIEKNEKTQVEILLLQSVFFGIFNGLLDIVAHTLFLDSYSPGLLPMAYLVSGIVGILITAVYSRLQNILSFNKVSLINLSVISIFSIFLRLGYDFFPNSSVSFSILVMFGPLRILGLVGFWGTVVRLFTLRQGKRLFGMIDTGQVFGVVLSSYSVPFLIGRFLEVKDLLWICSASMLASLIIQILILKKHKLVDKKTDSIIKEDRVFFLSLLKGRYVLMMSIFVLLSTVSAFFIQYSFLAVTKGKYPDSNDLGKFLGWFNGTLMVFSIFIKTFVYSKLLKTYGLRVSLAISPILLILFTAGAIFFGSTFGSVPETKGFILFFLVIALSRLFSVTLKESFEVPSFKVLYQSLEAKVRYIVQANIDGSVNEFAALFSGIALVIMGLFSFIDIIHYSYAILIVCGIWAIVALATYNNYQISLRKSMENFQKHHVTFKEKDKVSQEQTEEVISLDKLKRFERVMPKQFKELVIKKIMAGDNVVKKYIKERQGREILFYPWQQSLPKEVDHYVKKLFSSEFEEMEKMASMLDTYEKVQSLVHSKKVKDRILAARIIEKDKTKKYNGLLIQLMRDISDSVKKAAIDASSYADPNEFSILCLELLENKKYCAYAFEALVEMGEPIINILEQMFFKTNTEIKSLVRITSIMGEIGGENAQKHLLGKLTNTHIEVVRRALVALNKADYNVAEKDRPKVIQAIREQAGIAIWNMIAQYVINSVEKAREELKDAMQKELETSFDLIFQLLAVIYDKAAILQIRENLESGTSEGIGFAIELLDLFIDEELKPILFPLFEDSSVEEKIRKLEVYYPIQVLEEEQIFRSLLNRGYNVLSHRVKIWVLQHIYEQPKFKVTDDLIAQLFNRDPLIRQLAAIIIYTKDRKRYEDCTKRLSEKDKFSLDKYVKTHKKENDIEYNKLVQIGKYGYFANLSEKEILEFARALEIVDNRCLPEMKSNPENGRPYLYFLVEGVIEIATNRGTKQINKNSIIDGSVFSGQGVNVQFEHDVLMFRLHKEDFSDILFESIRDQGIDDRLLPSIFVMPLAN